MNITELKEKQVPHNSSENEKKEIKLKPFTGWSVDLNIRIGIKQMQFLSEEGQKRVKNGILHIPATKPH